MLDRRFVADLLLPFLVAGLTWAVVARDAGHEAIDPAALILTVLALLAATQALFGVPRIAHRLALSLRARRCRLTLGPEVLRLALAGEVIEVPRDAIWGVAERGHWGTRAGGRRFSPVYVVTDPAAAGRTHLTLPPVFGESPGQIAETLMRWRGPLAAGPAEAAPPAALKSRIYDDAASGAQEPGTIAVRHGRGWLARGPYMTALLGLALVFRWIHFDEMTAWLIGPEMVYILLFATLMVPVVWIVLTLRELRPRKGLAFVLTPTALLIRTRRGVLETPLRALGAPTIDVRRAWSVTDGLHAERTLILPRKDEPPIRYEEAFLGVPAEVALTLFTTKKRFAPNATPAPEAASEDRD